MLSDDQSSEESEIRIEEWDRLLLTSFDEAYLTMVGAQTIKPKSTVFSFRSFVSRLCS